MINVSEELKVALREGTVHKEFYLDIGGLRYDNSYIVAESVQITDSVCSGEAFQFGLMEGSILEVEVFQPEDAHDSPGTEITTYPHIGSTIDAWMRVKIGNTNHDIKLGRFLIDKISVQPSTGIRKITAYSQIAGGYIDRSVKAELYKIPRDTKYATSLSVNGIIDYLMANNLGLTNSDYITFNKPLTDMSTGFEYHGPIRHPEYGSAEGVGTVDFIGKKITITDDRFIYNFNNVYLDKIFEQTSDLLNHIEYMTSPATFKPQYRSILDSILGVQVTSIYGGTVNDIYSYLPWRWAEGDYGTSRSQYDLKFISDAKTLTIFIPFYVRFNWEYNGVTNDPHTDTYYGKYNSTQLLDEISTAQITRRVVNEAGRKRIVISNINDYELYDMTLRNMQSALFEIEGRFGKISRDKPYLYSGVSLYRGSFLTPRETMNPTDNIYPNGGGYDFGYASMYSKLWIEESSPRKFKELIVTYKSTDGSGNPIERTMSRTINSDGTDNYNCSNNWLFLNFVWTETEIQQYVDAMASELLNYEWMPFEMDCAGLPYLEPGDAIEIQTRTKNVLTYILRRELRGVQNLQDTFINGYVDCY